MSTPISVTGKLPVPIVVNGNPESLVTMTALTISQSLQALADSKKGEFLQISELSSMLTWTHGATGATAITYAQLASSAHQNLAYLHALRAELEEKERLAAAPAPSAS